jgi:hypothetical protein
MKLDKNYLLAGSSVLLLLVSSVFSVPGETHGHDRNSLGPIRPFAVRPSITPSPVSGGRNLPARLKRQAATVTASNDQNDDLLVDASFEDEQISLERRRHRFTSIACHGVHIKKAVLDMRATVTGADADRASLLYGLAWLAGNPDPLGAVRALGYDIDVSKQVDRPCTDGSPNQMCVERARQLATLIDATLGLGSTEERLLFRQSAAALGIAPDCNGRTSPEAAPAVLEALPDSAANLSLDASLGDEQIDLSRRTDELHHVKYMVFKLKEVIISGVRHASDETPDEIELHARITGQDRKAGGLLYALAWRAGVLDPLGSVRALGYDIDVIMEQNQPCTDRSSGQACVESARRLASLIDGTLGLGSVEERARFRRDAAAIGIAPVCSPQEP